jgi:ankyrin repeat protein
MLSLPQETLTDIIVLSTKNGQMLFWNEFQPLQVCKELRSKTIIIYNSNYYWYSRYKLFMCTEAQLDWCDNWTLLRQHSNIFQYGPTFKKAARRNHNSIVKLILKSNFEYEYYNFNSLVITCLKNNNPNLAKYLLDHTRTPASNKMLSISCSKGYIDCVNMLLNYKYINPAHKDNESMRRAITYGHSDIVERLLLCPEINSSHNDDIFIVMTASGKKSEHNIIFDKLLKLGSDPSAWNNRAIINAAKIGNYYLVNLLLCDPRVNPADDSNQAIIEAAYHGHDKVVELLLTDLRVDPSAQFNEALILASYNGHYNVVDLLLKNSRVNLSSLINNPIILASQNNQYEIVELLLMDLRINPSERNNEAIRIASIKGYHKIVELLIKDSRINPSDYCNEAIILSSKAGYHKVVELLLKDKRVEDLMYKKSLHGDSPIIIASSRNRCKVVRILLKYQNINVSILNTAFENAIINLCVGVVKILLEDSRADPSIKKNYYIRMAARRGYHAIVKILLKDTRVETII